MGLEGGLYAEEDEECGPMEDPLDAVRTVEIGRPPDEDVDWRFRAEGCWRPGRPLLRG
jgi:hypothetical protein